MRKVANLTIRFFGVDKNPPSSQLLRDIVEMADYVDAMLDKALNAFEAQDLKLARDVMRTKITCMKNSAPHCAGSPPS